MTLTAEKIEEIWNAIDIGPVMDNFPLHQWQKELRRVFALAILKEAAKEYVPVAWMSDSEQRLFSHGQSAFVTAYNHPVRIDGMVLYRKK